MANKAARRRQRERERRREQDALDAQDAFRSELGHAACADAALEVTRNLLDDALEILSELAAHSTGSRNAWPAVPEADELRGVFEAVRGVALECGAKLEAVRDRASRFHEGDHHLHLAAGRVVRMVAVDARSRIDDGSDDDLPF
jgi:hypothetical protein